VFVIKHLRFRGIRLISFLFPLGLGFFHI